MKAQRLALNTFRCQSLARKNFSTLILAEHFEGQIGTSVGSCLTAAKELNDPHVSIASIGPFKINLSL